MPVFYPAVVQKVIAEGRHGPYAKAKCEDPANLGTITFSLDSSVWQEETWPEEGDYVILTQVKKKRAGWRAQSGRFFTPSDGADKQSA
jgi:hypothetical protein